MIEIDRKHVESSMKNERYNLYSTCHLRKPSLTKRLSFALRRLCNNLINRKFIADCIAVKNSEKKK